MRFVKIWLCVFCFMSVSLGVGVGLSYVPVDYWPLMGAVAFVTVVTLMAATIYKGVPTSQDTGEQR